MEIQKMKMMINRIVLLSSSHTKQFRRRTARRRVPDNRRRLSAPAPHRPSPPLNPRPLASSQPHGYGLRVSTTLFQRKGPCPSPQKVNRTVPSVVFPSGRLNSLPSLPLSLPLLSVAIRGSRRHCCGVGVCILSHPLR